METRKPLGVAIERSVESDISMTNNPLEARVVDIKPRQVPKVVKINKQVFNYRLIKKGIDVKEERGLIREESNDKEKGKSKSKAEEKNNSSIA